MKPIRSTPFRDPVRSTSPIRRTSKHLGTSLFFVVVLSMACVGSCLAAMNADDPFLLGVVALLSGSSAVGMFVSRVLRAPGDAPCPECGTRIVDLDRNRRMEGILCCCGRFLEVGPEGLHATPLNAVAEQPTFGATMPESFVWPSGCAVCDAPPTQYLPIMVVDNDATDNLIKVALGAAMVATAASIGVGFISRSGQRVAIDVPHCPEHEDGVVLANGGRRGAVMLFRSYAYQRAFRMLNGTTSVESPDTHRSTE